MILNYSKLKQMILEGKVDVLKAKYPDVDVDALAKDDPSGNQSKYIEWMVKQVSRGHRKEDIVPTVQFFHRNFQRFKNKDINSYKDLKNLEDAVKEVGDTSKRQEREQEKTSGAFKLHSDDDATLMRIDNKKASMLYGANTKWCITMKDASYYEQYTMSNVVFYFILTKKDKFALAYQRDKKNKIVKLDIFDAKDRSIKKQELAKFIPAEKVEEFLKTSHADAVSRPKAFIARLTDNEVKLDEFKREYPTFREMLAQEEYKEFADDIVKQMPKEFLKHIVSVEKDDRILSSVNLVLNKEAELLKRFRSGDNDAVIDMNAKTVKSIVDEFLSSPKSYETAPTDRYGSEPALTRILQAAGPTKAMKYFNDNLDRIDRFHPINMMSLFNALGKSSLPDEQVVPAQKRLLDALGEKGANSSDAESLFHMSMHGESGVRPPLVLGLYEFFLGIIDASELTILLNSFLLKASPEDATTMLASYFDREGSPTGLYELSKVKFTDEQQFRILNAFKNQRTKSTRWSVSHLFDSLKPGSEALKKFCDSYDNSSPVLTSVLHDYIFKSGNMELLKMVGNEDALLAVAIKSPKSIDAALRGVLTGMANTTKDQVKSMTARWVLERSSTSAS